MAILAAFTGLWTGQTAVETFQIVQTSFVLGTVPMALTRTSHYLHYVLTLLLSKQVRLFWYIWNFPGTH